MMKKHSKNLLAIAVGVVCVIPCVSTVWSFFALSDAYAQENTTTDESEKIKEALLRPGGWLAEWQGNSAGVSEYMFEDRAGKVVGTFNTPAWNMTCERDVTITSDGVKYDACYDTDITLYFDPNDQEYPFKGESPNVNYKLKAK